MNTSARNRFGLQLSCWHETGSGREKWLCSVIPVAATRTTKCILSYSQLQAGRLAEHGAAQYGRRFGRRRRRGQAQPGLRRRACAKGKVSPAVQLVCLLSVAERPLAGQSGVGGPIVVIAYLYLWPLFCEMMVIFDHTSQPRVFPRLFDAVRDAGRACVSVDGDADRVVCFFAGKQVKRWN